MRILIHICCLLVVLVGHNAFASSSVSPSEEVQKNFQQLMETNSCPNCDLSGAVLNRFDLSGANLEGANLAGAKLYLADLTGVNLQNANLQGTALGGADLTDSDLRGANLTGAIIEGAYLVGAKMNGNILTRRPHVEDGGPEAGELVHVDDENNSKNLPFTNNAFVESPQEPEKRVATEHVNERKQAPVVTEQSSQQKEAAATVSRSQQDVRNETQESLPKGSKKLAMIADAVVPEVAVEEKPGVEINNNTVDMGVEKEDIADQQEMEPVEVPRPEEMAQVVEEKDEEVQGTVAEEKVEVIQKKAPSKDMDKQLPVETIPDTEIMEVAVAEDKVEVMQEEAPGEGMIEKVIDQDTEQIVVLDENTVVAEVATVEETVTEPVVVAAAQDISPEQPVREESLPDMEKPDTGLAETESKGSVQEEIIQPEQVEQIATEQILPSKPSAPESEENADDDPATVPVDERKELLVEKLLDDNRCVECDLSGVDLSGKNLDEADLERANLQGADLSDADLSEANLKGADMRGANLRDADLREADLYRANLSSADLTGARFEEALIDMISISDAIGANLEGALSEE